MRASLRLFHFRGPDWWARNLVDDPFVGSVFGAWHQVLTTGCGMDLLVDPGHQLALEDQIVRGVAMDATASAATATATFPREPIERRSLRQVPSAPRPPPPPLRSHPAAGQPGKVAGDEAAGDEAAAEG